MDEVGWDEVKCPYCGHIIRDLWEYDLSVDGEEYEWDNCWKPIVIGMEINYWIEKGEE